MSSCSKKEGGGNINDLIKDLKKLIDKYGKSNKTRGGDCGAKDEEHKDEKNNEEHIDEKNNEEKTGGGKNKKAKKEPTKKTNKPPNAWIQALQRYNKERKAKNITCTNKEDQDKPWHVPKNGTKEYDHVMKFKKEIEEQK
jgi:hypothetical protein